MPESQERELMCNATLFDVPIYFEGLQQDLPACLRDAPLKCHYVLLGSTEIATGGVRSGANCAAGRTEIAPGSLTVLGIAGPDDQVDEVTGSLNIFR